MARQSISDRKIPHLRDIFGFDNNNNNNNNQVQLEKLGKLEETSLSNNQMNQTRNRDYSKILTERDVKHLEQHLSMKKTIRKKIMRDLQQAFVEDPNEFRVDDDIPLEKLKAEINYRSLSFGFPSQKHRCAIGNTESTFLEMLRADGEGFDKRLTNGYGYDSSRSRSPERMPSIVITHHFDTDEDSTNSYDSLETTLTPKENSKFWRRFTIKNPDKR
ncbi:uncharacterized protein LOC123260633 [Cotesia glomerata]|uniref:Uncharacterized protein n=1 Tax=Cotesia glomerata TaxID=32391 RepID=A0AAV7IDR2_COTGL|nr:uncharacterized protein LOC123260633 [Cotesia glomerata]KAH0550455.1 hypothetical protein KQX54_019496 [Cotesia glomerata]